MDDARDRFGGLAGVLWLMKWLNGIPAGRRLLLMGEEAGRCGAQGQAALACEPGPNVGSFFENDEREGHRDSKAEGLRSKEEASLGALASGRPSLERRSRIGCLWGKWRCARGEVAGLETGAPRRGGASRLGDLVRAGGRAHIRTTCLTAPSDSGPRCLVGLRGSRRFRGRWSCRRLGPAGRVGRRCRRGWGRWRGW